MKCPVCRKIIGGNTTAKVSSYVYVYETYVVPFHQGKNGKPCSGSGAAPK